MVGEPDAGEGQEDEQEEEVNFFRISLFNGIDRTHHLPVCTTDRGSAESQVLVFGPRILTKSETSLPASWVLDLSGLIVLP